MAPRICPPCAEADPKIRYLRAHPEKRAPLALRLAREERWRQEQQRRDEEARRAAQEAATAALRAERAALVRTDRTVKLSDVLHSLLDHAGDLDEAIGRTVLAHGERDHSEAASEAEQLAESATRYALRLHDVVRRLRRLADAKHS